jgi:signal peptidase I
MRSAEAGRSRVRLAATVAVVLGIVLLVRGLVAEPRAVASESMEPTLHPGSVVLVDKIGPRLRGIHREDLVVFASPQDGQESVKRVVAVAGQHVAIRDADLYVDDVLVDEPQVDHSRIDGLWFGPVTVPDRAVFVLGDARSGSVDSRVYGAVPLGAIHGRVALVW